MGVETSLREIADDLIEDLVEDVSSTVIKPDVHDCIIVNTVSAPFPD